MNALLLALTLTLSGPTVHARCSGGANCHACKNCNYCGHCAIGGGTCSVCSGSAYRLAKAKRTSAKSKHVSHRRKK